MNQAPESRLSALSIHSSQGTSDFPFAIAPVQQLTQVLNGCLAPPGVCACRNSITMTCLFLNEPKAQGRPLCHMGREEKGLGISFPLLLEHITTNLVPYDNTTLCFTVLADRSPTSVSLG